MPKFTQIPSKKYWGVFYLSHGSATCVAMFLAKVEADIWVTERARVPQPEDDYLVQECFAQISVRVAD